MSGGLFGGLPSFAQDHGTGLSPGLLDYLRMQGQQQGQPDPQGVTLPTISADVPQAMPPGFTGYDPATPPTGAPTGVVQPGATSLAQAAMGALGPGSAQAATPDGADIRGRFIGALQSGGLTNPNGLGAVAAYAQHESRYSPSNITGSWSDPSESGQAGTSGGILSWRADRLARMRDFTAGAADPVTAQAQFTLAENPRLTAALQSASSPEEAHRLMADAWKFAGYNRPGGENAARLATTQDYASRLASGQTLPGMSAPSGASMGATAQRGGFGLNGIQAQGSAIPGQASPNAALASLSGQPMTAGAASGGFSTDPAGVQPASPYGQLTNLLQGVQALQKGQGQGQGGGGFYEPKPVAPGGSAPSVAQARKLFDPSRFYSLLPRSRGLMR